jgi:protein-L-isoaspartate(D-aspartate) O-methyltransferase
MTLALMTPQVDRAHYAPASPYEDSPQPIGHRATISAPHMHANACESLLTHLQPGAKVLDVGSGSGYLTAVLANLVGPSGSVVGIDHIQPLVDMANTNMAKSQEGKRMLDSGQVKFVKGDGRKGWKEGAPYDAIHVGAAAAEHHIELTDQLKAPGRLFVPVAEGWMQHIYVIDKKEDGSLERKKLYGVQYVPLTDAPDLD